MAEWFKKRGEKKKALQAIGKDTSSQIYETLIRPAAEKAYQEGLDAAKDEDRKKMEQVSRKVSERDRQYKSRVSELQTMVNNFVSYANTKAEEIYEQGEKTRESGTDLMNTLRTEAEKIKKKRREIEEWADDTGKNLEKEMSI